LPEIGVPDKDGGIWNFIPVYIPESGTISIPVHVVRGVAAAAAGAMVPIAAVPEQYACSLHIKTGVGKMRI
jgi:hypothetical protein